MDNQRLMFGLIKYLRATGKEDENVVVTTHERGRLGGKPFPLVRLHRITSDGLDGDETDYFVTRCGNPDQVVLHTQSEAEATARYESEVAQANERERVWHDDHAWARR